MCLVHSHGTTSLGTITRGMLRKLFVPVLITYFYFQYNVTSTSNTMSPGKTFCEHSAEVGLALRKSRGLQHYRR